MLLWVILKQFKEVLASEVLIKVLLFSLITVDCGKGHAFFVNLTAVDFLLNRANRKQAIHNYIPFLAYTEDAINSLVVVRRVPVRVQNDCAVGPCEI